MGKFTVGGRWVLLGVSFFMLFLSVSLIAEDITPLPNESIWAAVVGFIGGLTGGQYVGFLGIAAGVVTVAVTFFRTTIGANLSGIWTLAVLYGLSAAAILLQGIAAGDAVGEILRNSVFMGAVLNSINEILKHAFEKKEPVLQGPLPRKR